MIGVTLPVWHFAIPLDVIVLGAITGTTYGLFGMGLTLTYQSSRAINFAQGTMGSLPHLLVASLIIDHGYGYWTALALALGAALISGALLEFTVIRRLAHAPRLIVLVATLGASQLFLIPLSYILNLSHTRLGQHGYPVPFKGYVNLGHLRLESGQLMILVVSPVILIGLTLFLRRTSVGMASRALAENAEAAQLAGVPISRVSLIVWALAGLLAGAAAILNGPTQPIFTAALAGGTAALTSSGDLLLRGLGAAMMGGLISLPQVFVAGVGLGVVEALVRWNYPSSGGTIQLVMMVIIVGSLLIRRDLRTAARGSEESSWSLTGSVRALPERVKSRPRVRAAHLGFIATLIGLLIVLPLPFAQSQRLLFTAVLLFMLMGLSLVVLTGWAGQVSIGHFAFVALGAYVGGRMHQLGYPVFGAVVIAVAASAAIAVVVGLPALRVRGLFLAVTTLAFAVVVDSWLAQQTWLVKVSGGSSSLRIQRPHWGGINFENELVYYYLILGIVVLAALAVYQLRGSGIARQFQAVRDNEPMAAALSVSPATAKLMAFVAAGAMASFAGYLYGMLLVNFQMSGLTNTSNSLSMLTMVILGGATTITGAALGALYIRGIPYFFHSQVAALLSSGVGLLLALMFVPGGLASLAFRLRDRAVRMIVGSDDRPDDRQDLEVRVLHLEPRPKPSDAIAARRPIETHDIAVHFGGVQALDGVSLHADHGEIIGLIGPNGAGKTTLFDILSGLTKPDRGSVHLFGEDVTQMATEERARMGLGRSFQQARLFDDMTVIEALELAFERQEPSEFMPSLLGLPPARAAERRKHRQARELVELLGLGPFSELTAQELSTGSRRVTELGCIVALGAEVVLLDEPTGGIAQREAEAFTVVLRQIRDYLDATMVVVAHDIPMILGLVDRVYVLASGAVIAEGPPSLIQSDPRVLELYFGTSESPARRRSPTSVLDYAGRPAPAH